MSRRGTGAAAGLAAAVAAAVGLYGFDSRADERADQRVEEMLAALLPGMTMTYGTVESNAAGNRIALNDVVFTVDYGEMLDALSPEAAVADANLAMIKNLRLDGTMASMVIDDFDTEHPTPHFATYEIVDFTIAPSGLTPVVQGVLAAFFPDGNISGDARMSYHGDPDAGDLVISDYHLAVDGIGALTMAGQFSGLYDWASPDGTGPANAEELAIGRFLFSFNDDSLTDRLFNLMAAANGTTVDEARQSAILLVALAAAELEHPKAQEALAATIAFLAEPGTITFAIAPPTPFRMDRFATVDPAESEQLLDELNLTVVSE